MKEIKVDIVIPIYNAYDYTKKCIETVIENTDLKINNLVLINDKSPDKRLSVLLKEVKENNKDLNIIVIESSENNGFVKTVNIGMSYSKNDVVLLNSDTEVTKNWLEKLKKCAYSRKNVASVTPLSNNATLASVPNYLEENEIPDYLELEQYAKDIEDCSFELYPEIPTGHGYCMYITRKSIDAIGLFDDVTFEKGYGEENDFSYRAIKNGFVNLLCDNTFIYHKGTQSFSKEKEEFILSHLKKLSEMHNECYNNTDNYCKNYPTKYIQDNIKYYINNKYRKNILLLVHDFRDEKSEVLGGTTLHIYDLINNLRKEMNFHVMYPDMNCIKIKSFFENSTATINLGRINTYNKINLYNSDYKNSLEIAFKLINVDIIHIHHLLNQYLDIFNIAKEKNIPICVTLHDFYTLCPTIQLLDYQKKCCINNENKDCNTCLKNLIGTEGNIIDNWKKEFYDMLKMANKIITPSNNTKKIVLSEFPELNIDAIEHGVEKTEVLNKENVNENFDIAFIGGINEQKGVNILKELVEFNIADKDLKIHLFGKTSIEEMNSSNNNYIYHGAYNRNDITNLLNNNNIKLICLFSIWPETYSYTLTEAVNAEIPVLTLDIGAIADRTKENNCGWILKSESDSKTIYNKILEIKNNPKEYEEKKKATIKYKNKIKTVNEMVEEYKKIYYSYIKEKNMNENILDKEYTKLLLSTSQYILEDEYRMREYHNSVTYLMNELNIGMKAKLKNKIFTKLKSLKIVSFMKKSKLGNKILKIIYNTFF